jgi:hypothetical protein
VGVYTEGVVGGSKGGISVWEEKGNANAKATGGGMQFFVVEERDMRAFTSDFVGNQAPIPNKEIHKKYFDSVVKSSDSKTSKLVNTKKNFIERIMNFQAMNKIKDGYRESEIMEDIRSEVNRERNENGGKLIQTLLAMKRERDERKRRLMDSVISKQELVSCGGGKSGRSAGDGGVAILANHCLLRTSGRRKNQYEST